MAAVTDEELFTRIAMYTNELFIGLDDSMLPTLSTAERTAATVVEPSFVATKRPSLAASSESLSNESSPRDVERGVARDGEQYVDHQSVASEPMAATVVQFDTAKRKRGIRGSIGAIAATVVLLGGLAVGVIAGGFGSSREDPLLVAGWIPKGYQRGVVAKLEGEPPALSVPEGTSGAPYLNLTNDVSLSFVSVFVQLKEIPFDFGQDTAFPEALDPSKTTVAQIATTSKTIKVGKEKVNVTLEGHTYRVNETDQTFTNWAGSYAIGKHTVHILSLADPGTLQMILSTLDVHTSGVTGGLLAFPTIGSLPKAWVNETNSSFGDPYARPSVVRYVSTKDKRVEFSILSGVLRLPHREPTEVLNGRRIWDFTPPGADASLATFASVEYEGVSAQIGGTLSHEDLMHVAANVHLITNVERSKEIDLSPVYAVGSETMEGRILESGTLPDGTRWRNVQPRDPLSGLVGLVGLIGVPDAQVDTRFPGTLTAEWAGQRETMTIFAFPATEDPKEVVAKIDGKTLRVPFLAAKTLTYRYAFVPVKLDKTADVSIEITDHGVAKTRHSADLIWDKKGLTR
jgi:hypothetical protein